MSLQRLLFRFTFLIAAFLLPALVIAFILSGKTAALGLLFLLVIAFFAALTLSEALIRRHLNIKGYPQKQNMIVGIQNTLKRVALRTGGSLPRLEIFPETSRFCLVVRALGSQGTIFLSQGTLTGNSEEELRQTLERAVTLSREKGITFSSTLLIFIVAAFEVFPPKWQDYILNPVETSSQSRPLHDASPFSVLCFLIFRPIIRCLIALTGGQNAKAGIQPHSDKQASEEALVYLCRQQ